jgi:voltage-gated sodium channel
MTDRLEHVRGIGAGWSERLAQARQTHDAVRTFLQPIIDSPLFDKIVLVLILVNAATLGLETSEAFTGSFGGLLYLSDRLILGFFVVELLSRIIVRGKAFWKDGWSVFDFLVVAITVLPFSDNISVLRALRTIRALRLVSAVPSMRRVVNGLFAAMPGMGSIVLLLGIIFYVFAVMATNMFAVDFPKQFGSIGASAFTLFQIMSLDGWSGEVARPVMELHPWSWVFFIGFILITSFTVLNLFIGIIVDAMQQQHNERMSRSDLVTAKRIGKLDGLSASAKDGGDNAEPAKAAEAKPDPRFESMMTELRILKDEIRSLNGGSKTPSGKDLGKDLADAFRSMQKTEKDPG